MCGDSTKVWMAENVAMMDQVQSAFITYSHVKDYFEYGRGSVYIYVEWVDEESSLGDEEPCGEGKERIGWALYARSTTIRPLTTRHRTADRVAPKGRELYTTLRL